MSKKVTLKNCNQGNLNGCNDSDDGNKYVFSEMRKKEIFIKLFMKIPWKVRKILLFFLFQIYFRITFGNSKLHKWKGAL